MSKIKKIIIMLLAIILMIACKDSEKQKTGGESHIAEIDFESTKVIEATDKKDEIENISVDILENSPVISVTEGIVKVCIEKAGYRKAMIIQHKDNIYAFSVYTHLKDFKISLGDTVNIGDTIAFLTNWDNQLKFDYDELLGIVKNQGLFEEKGSAVEGFPIISATEGIIAGLWKTSSNGHSVSIRHKDNNIFSHYFLLGVNSRFSLGSIVNIGDTISFLDSPKSLTDESLTDDILFWLLDFTDLFDYDNTYDYD